MDTWEELADQVELVEAEEAVGEDDGVEGGPCSGLDGGVWDRRFRLRTHTVFGADFGIVVCYRGTEV